MRPCPRTVAALGRGVGIRRDHMRHYVRGEITPSLDRVVRMADALRVPAGDVIGACLEAQREYRERQAVERARKEAELE